MQHENSATGLENSPAPGAREPLDVKNLWEQWDQVQREESPVKYVKGWNLLGLVLFLAGLGLELWGAGTWKAFGGPIFLTSGALILGVKKFQSLRQIKSLGK